MDSVERVAHPHLGPDVPQQQETGPRVGRGAREPGDGGDAQAIYL